MRQRLILGSGAALVLIVILVQYRGFQVNQQADVVEEQDSWVNVTLLTNAGVMIEARGMRIYIDPCELPPEYGDSPGDVILITHNHGDHYQQSTVNMLQKEGTVNVFPEVMSAEIARHDGVGVDPGDELEFGPVKITAFYMYTFSPVAGQAATHPAESNFTSYVVEVDGFTVFHAGDSKNLPEYGELSGEIDVAMLPLGPGCQTMADVEVVAVVRVIEPSYFIPIHFTEGNNDIFVSRYGSSIESTTECEVCNLDHFTTHAFETGEAP